MKWVVIILVILFSVRSYGYITPLFENYTTESGLISNVVYEVFQDAQKRIWFATDKGASMYDGIKWKNFHKSDGISDNEVFQIRQDRHNNIWLLTENGIPTIIRNDKVISKNINWINQYQPNGFLYAFCEDHNGYLWIGSERQGLFRISQKNEVKHFPYADPTYASLTTDIISINEKILALNIYGFNTIENDSIRTYHSHAQLHSIPRGIQINKDYYAISENELFHYRLDSFSTPIDTISFPSNIINLSQKSENELWVATRNGLFVFHTILKKRIGHYLQGLSISSICNDHQNGVWISTLTQGVYYTSSLDVGILESKSDSLTEIYKVHRRDSKIWVGGIEGNFGFVNKEQQIEHINWKEHQGEGILGTVKTIRNETYCSLPYLINISQKPYEHYGLNANEIIELDSGLFICNASAIYFYPWNELQQFSRRTRKAFFIDKQKRIDHLLMKTPGKSAVLVDDTIWIGTPVGLKSHPDSKKEILPNRTIMDICAFSPNDIWICTHGEGLYRLYNHQILPVHIPNKELSFCKKITKGRDGELWVSTAHEIYLFHVKDAHYKGREILFKNATINNQINDFEFYEDTLYIGSKRGLIQVPTSHLLNYEESFLSDTIMVTFNHQLITNDTLFNLPFDINEINFNLYLPSYYAKQEFEYRIKYDGNNWANWKKISGNQLYFPGLPAGKNHLEIRCKYANGLYTKTFETTIQVSLPFWMHPLFWVILSFSFIGIIALLIRLDILSKRNLQKIRNQLILKLTKEETIFVKNVKNGTEVRVKVADIRYIKSANNYVEIYLKDLTNILVRTTLKEIQERLSQYHYHHRIHKSYIVNTAYIREISKKAVVLSDLEIPVGRTYKEQINRIQKDWMKSSK